jgi:hypothetical protein
MTRCVLYGITCQDKQEGIRDEAYMLVNVDNEDHWHEIWSSKMNTGDAKTITWASDFRHSVQIRVMESDGGARAAGFTGAGDDELGHFTVRPPANDTGMLQETLTARVGGLSSVYKVSYEVLLTPGRVSDSDWIMLTRLHCNDAKGATDNVYLTLRDHTIWGPEDMKTGNDRTLNRTVYITGQNRLQLWEKDSVGSNDPLGSDTITVGSYGDANSDGEYQIQFRWSRSRLRDSNYTLYFRRVEGTGP